VWAGAASPCLRQLLMGEEEGGEDQLIILVPESDGQEADTLHSLLSFARDARYRTSKEFNTGSVVPSTLPPPPSKEVCESFQQCCGSGMFIPDPNFFRSRIQGRKDPGSGSATKN
jgi:hypothetical protein